MARILIVDESLLDRKRIATALAAVGHQIVEAAGAGEAWQCLSGEPRGSFQLIITEFLLPDAQGLEFLRALRRDPASAGIPVLVVTPRPARETVIEAILAGAESMVAKPFAGEVLLRRVTEILGSQRLLRQVEAGTVSWSLEEYLRREVKRAERTRRPLSVLVALPGGSGAGGGTGARDALLKALHGSQEIRLRETDLIFGLGDGHVVVVLPDTDEVGVQVVESRIRQLLGQVVEASGGRPTWAAGVAMGAATLPADGVDPELLLQAAVARAGAARARQQA